LLKKL
jgi:hypothetical protein